MSQTRPAIPRQPLATSVGIADLFSSLAVVWQRRELVWILTARNVKSRYKQSVLGYAWVIVNPLMLMLILSFVFSTILRIPSADVPYPLFLFVGLLPWMFFSNSVSSGTDSIVGSAGLVTKVYFPREILVIATVFANVVDLFFGLLILFGLMAYFGESPAWTVVWIPLIFGIHLVFTVGVALPLAALNLFFHDVRYLVGVALLAWFYMTPIIYPVDLVPDRYRFLFDVNPNALLVNVYRRVLLQGESPGVERLLLGIGVVLLTLLVGYYLFKRMEAGFADRI